MASDDTRERIIEAAAAQFAARGYDGTSTRELARASGVNVATLAYHFGGKEGLYHAVLDRMHARLLEVPLPDDAPGRGDPGQRLRDAVAAIYRFCRREQDAVRLLLRHAVDHGALPEPVNARWSPLLIARAQGLRDALGLPDATPPLALLSLNHLIARYAISPPAAIAPFTPDDPDDAVAAHLGDVAVALLAGGEVHGAVG